MTKCLLCKKSLNGGTKYKDGRICANCFNKLKLVRTIKSMEPPKKLNARARRIFNARKEG